MSCGTIALLFCINACVVFQYFMCFVLGVFFGLLVVGVQLLVRLFDLYLLVLSFWNDVVLSAFQVQYHMLANRTSRVKWVRLRW
jgi:hypothetical protein